MKKANTTLKSSSINLLRVEPLKYLFKGIIAFVEVKINQLDKSSCVTTRLKSMGATIAKRLSKRCTHLVFKDGRATTYNKAKNLGLHIVSVSWIEACRKKEIRLPEKDFPCCNRKQYECDNAIASFDEIKDRGKLYKTKIKKSNERQKPILTANQKLSKRIVEKYPILLKRSKVSKQCKRNSKASILMKSLFSEAEEEPSESPNSFPLQTVDCTPSDFLTNSRKTMILPYQKQSFLHSNESSSEDSPESKLIKYAAQSVSSSQQDVTPKYYTTEFQSCETKYDNNDSLIEAIENKSKEYQDNKTKYYTSEFISKQEKTAKNIESVGAKEINLISPMITTEQENILDAESLSNILPEQGIEFSESQPHYDGFNFDSSLDNFLDTFLEAPEKITNSQKMKSSNVVESYSSGLIETSDEVAGKSRLDSSKDTKQDSFMDRNIHEKESSDKNIQSQSSSSKQERNISGSKIMDEIKQICLKILDKPPTYDISKIKMQNKYTRNKKDTLVKKLGGNIEAEIISNCAKILGYSVS